MTGVRGVGKTELAATYARGKIAAGWRLVAWINAADNVDLLAGLAAVTDATGLSEVGSGRDAAHAGRALRQWLEVSGQRCLLVFDNVRDPEEVQPFVPVGRCRPGTNH